MPKIVRRTTRIGLTLLVATQCPNRGAHGDKLKVASNERNGLVMAGQKQNRERNKNDKQDGESCADDTDEVAEGSHVLDQSGMLGGIALYRLAQERELILDAPHIDRLVLHLEMEFAVAGLDFSEPLMQLFLGRGLGRARATGHAEQLSERLYRTVIDHAQASGEDRQQRLQLTQALQQSGAGLFHLSESEFGRRWL